MHNSILSQKVYPTSKLKRSIVQKSDICSDLEVSRAPGHGPFKIHVVISKA